MPEHESQSVLAQRATSSTMPVVFVGHGSPMNIVEDNEWSRGFARLGGDLPRPAAILSISAHWYGQGTWLTVNNSPRTIHDFGGFPSELYEIQYPAPGSPDLARRVRTLLGEDRAGLSSEWGLDHGTWSVLHHMYPEAGIPVLQLSIDRSLSMRQHLELARDLAQLRGEGVLILGSGNITHNLRDAMVRIRTGDNTTPQWALDYDRRVADAALAHDVEAIVRAWDGSGEGRLAHPSPDHWIPMLYAFGAATEGDSVSFPTEGFHTSLSMRNIVFG